MDSVKMDPNSLPNPESCAVLARAMVETVLEVLDYPEPGTPLGPRERRQVAVALVAARAAALALERYLTAEELDAAAVTIAPATEALISMGDGITKVEAPSRGQA